MADFYTRGAALLQGRGEDTAYPLLNVRWAELAMKWQGVDGERVLAWNLPRDLDAVRAELALKERREGPQFWQDSLRVDCELLETIHTGPPAAERIREIADKYRSRREYASARQFASICDHLDFLVAMSEPLPDLAPVLAELRVRVGGPASAAPL
jgi:hypothetical protein